MSSESDDAAWARDHRACFQVAPLIEMREKQKIQVGFTIDLYAGLPMDKTPGEERRRGVTENLGAAAGDRRGADPRGGERRSGGDRALADRSLHPPREPDEARSRPPSPCFPRRRLLHRHDRGRAHAPVRGRAEAGRDGPPVRPLVGRKMKKKVASGPILASLVASLLGCAKKEAPPPPPPDVKVATVLQKDVPIYVEAIGQTRGSTEIEVRARVEGFLQTVDFKEGNPVRKGQLLYTIDPRPFEAALAQAKGKLAEAEAQLARAKQDVVRYEPLVAKNAISRQEYETAVVVQRAAEASVEAAKAVGGAGGARPRLHEGRWPPRTAWRARPRSTRGRSWAGDRARCSPTSRRSARSTSASRSPSGTTSTTRAGARSAAASRRRTQLPFELVLADGSSTRTKGQLVFVDRNVDPADRHHPAGGGVPQPRRDRAARAVRPRAGGGGPEEGRDPGAAARRLGAAGHLQRRGRGRRRHGRDAHGEAGAADRHARGSSTRASRPASGSWSRACRRSGRASRSSPRW